MFGAMEMNGPNAQVPARKGKKRRKPYQSVASRIASKAGIQSSGDHSDSTHKKQHQLSQRSSVFTAPLESKEKKIEVKPKHLQPKSKDYGGMGLAKESVWIQLHDVEFREKYLDMYNEHIEGFSGKAFNKARRRELSKDMLWRVKLREKNESKDKINGKRSDASGEAFESIGKGGQVTKSKTHKSQTATGPRDNLNKGKLKAKAWLDNATAGHRKKIKTTGVNDNARQQAIDMYRAQQRLKKQREAQIRRR